MSLATNVKKKGDDVLLTVRVQPKASIEAVRLGTDGGLKISVTAPAVENAANQAVVSFLAKLLKTNKKSIDLVSGAHSRDKCLRIRNITESEVLRILEIHMKNG